MLAPVALGMVAPVAANAADLNMAAVNQYTSSEQVSSIKQLSAGFHQKGSLDIDSQMAF